MTEPTVTQADREAAAAIAVLVEMRELILAGRVDHHAEAFARHREQAHAAGLAEGVALGIEAALRDIAAIYEQWNCNAEYDTTALFRIGRVAKEALKGSTDA